jgi:hypothetical protein
MARRLAEDAAAITRAIGGIRSILCRTSWRAALGLGGSVRYVARMTGCRDGCIGLMAGVPQTADEFAGSHWSAALAFPHSLGHKLITNE